MVVGEGREELNKKKEKEKEKEKEKAQMYIREAE
jgi:hypothetical protein